MAKDRQKKSGQGKQGDTTERESHKSLLKNLDFVLRGRSKSREMEWSDSLLYFIFLGLFLYPLLWETVTMQLLNLKSRADFVRISGPNH